jgi:hypothetical protein
VTDAGFITVIIGVATSLILILIGELQQEDRAVTDQLLSLPRNRKLGAEWDLTAVSLVHAISLLCSDLVDLLLQSPDRDL